MSLTKIQLPGMYNGVSTQNQALRLLTQGEAQENFQADLIKGLQLRPGTTYQGLVDEVNDWSDVAFVGQDFNGTELLFVLVQDDSDPLKVFDTAGNAWITNYDLLTYRTKTAGAVEVRDYINTMTSARDDLRLVFLKDAVLCLNKKISPEMIETVVSGMPPEETPKTSHALHHTAIITVLGTQTNSSYKITITCTDKFSGTAEAQVSSGSLDLAALTTALVNALNTALTAKNASHGFTVLITNNRILVKREADEIDFTISVADTYSGTQMTVIKDEVNSTADLPADATFGNNIPIIFKVSNEKKTAYYLSFNPSTKTWEETLGFNLFYKINPATMPIKFTLDFETHEVNITWIDWQDRVIGDEETCPTPSFIGDYLQNVFFYKNRLGFLTQSGIVMSKSGDLFNFWNDTALDVLDTDPIDYNVLSTSHITLTDSAATPAGIFLKSNEAQYVVHSGDQSFTPTTIVIDEVTNYRLGTCNLIKNEALLYLVGKQGNVWEYAIDGQSLNSSGNEITAHVQGYLPKTLWKGIAAENKIFYLDALDQYTIYLYQYTFSGEKIQSAWSKWTFTNPILNMTLINNQLYFLQSTGSNGTYLSSMDLEDVATSLAFPIRLDGMLNLTGVYDAETNKTTFTLPYIDNYAWQLTENPYVIVNLEEGTLLNNVQYTTSSTLTTPGNASVTTCLVGQKYRGKYQFSRIAPRDEKTGVLDTEAKFQLKRLSISFENTYTFDVVIQSPGREEIRNNYLNRILGLSLLGTTSLAEGDFSCLVLGNKDTTITLECFGFTPANFTGATIEGMYMSKAKSI